MAVSEMNSSPALTSEATVSLAQYTESTWSAYTDNGSNITVTTPYPPFFNDPDLLFHPHWRYYRSMIENIPDVVHYVLGVYIAAVGILALLGNGVVIYLFAKYVDLSGPGIKYVNQER